LIGFMLGGPLMKRKKEIRITLRECPKIRSELETIGTLTGYTTNTGAVRRAIEFYAEHLKREAEE